MPVRTPTFVLVLVMCAIAVASGQDPNRAASAAEELLFDAARAGDVARIEAALAKGANVDATARYNMTALIFAASNGRADAVKALVARGANVNAEDTFYRFTAGDAAAYNGHVDIVLFLLQRGWTGADELLLFGVQSDSVRFVNAALESRATRQGIQAAISAAERLKRTPLLSTLQTALGALPAEATPSPTPTSPNANATVASPSAISAPVAPVASTATIVTPQRTAPRNWPSFRGEAGAGNGDGQGVVAEWDVATGRNIKWKTAIPGLANSSPVDNGVATFYNARTGERVFRGRIGEGGAFSASPIAADGRLYVASEDGEIHVVAAEPGLMPIAKNDMKEVVMATPAISEGLMIVRTIGHVYGIGPRAGNAP